MRILMIVLSPLYVLGYVLGFMSLPFILGFNDGITKIVRVENARLDAVAEDELNKIQEQEG